MKKVILILSITLACIGILRPISAHALTETSFGGLDFLNLNSAICDCGGNSHWLLDYKTNSLLLLYYQAGSSVIYSNYNVDGVYQLGVYSSQSQACSIEIYNECYDIENTGTYGSLPGTGTTLVQGSKTDLLATASNPYLALFDSFKTKDSKIHYKKKVAAKDFCPYTLRTS